MEKETDLSKLRKMPIEVLFRPRWLRPKKNLFPKKKKGVKNMDVSTIYKKVIDCEERNIGYATDNSIRNKELTEYFRENEKYSCHSTIALLYSGTYPGKEKMTQPQIRQYLYGLSGCTIARNFVPQCIIRIKKKYGITSWPTFTKRHIDTEYDRRDRYGFGYCMECGKKFVIDPIKYPANLCGCLECFPNGIGFSKASTRVNIYQRKSESAA